VERSRFVLAREGVLAPRASAGDERTFAVDYGVGSAEYFSFWVESQAAQGLTWTSTPLPADRVLVGSPIIQLDVAADRADANVFAYLEALSPDGKAEVISFGRLAASHRRLARAPYDTLGLPWQSGLSTDHSPLTPGRFVAMRFSLTPTGRIVRTGQRLRVVVTGADPRQRNLATLREDPPPRITIRSGRRHSWLEVPWLPEGTQPD
jgi:hypothetical protein